MSDQSAGHSTGPVAFVRQYARSWIHAVATAALTAFGTLTFVHRAFAVVAVAAYVLPPLALYATHHRFEGTDDPTEGSRPAESRPEESGIELSLTDLSRTEHSARSGAVAQPSVAGGAGEAESADRSPWRRVVVPTEAGLHDAAVAGTGAYAVGADGVVLASDGDAEGTADWRVLLDDGPGAATRTLRCAAATDDGEVVWVAGDGGALARMETDRTRHVDFSAPADRTDSWTALAVGGRAGEETVLVADGGGGVMRGRYRDGDVYWADPVTPGSGSSIAAATLDGDRGFVCDSNDGVFETTDGGASFDRLPFDADGTPTAVATPAAMADCDRVADTVRIADTAGVVHRHEPDSGSWTPTRVADDALAGLAALPGFATNDDHAPGPVNGRNTGVPLDPGRAGWVACGEALFVDDGTDWARAGVPVSGSLSAVAAGPERALAVGVGGLVVERR